MLRTVLTATAVAALLAGCGGGDDQSGSGADGGGTPPAPSTPATPALTAYDPPKAFAPEAAVVQPQDQRNNQYTTTVGIVGQTAVVANLDGVSGRNVIGLSSWQLPAADAPTTTTSAVTKPMAVKLDGKDVIAMAYVQRVQGSGTQKAKGQVVFRWIDPVEGKAVRTVTFDLSAVLGPEAGGDDLVSQVYDAATGQVAVGVAPDSTAVATKAGSFMVYADPATEKATFVPFVQPAGLLNGRVVGTKGTDGEGITKRSIALVDGATGKITKDTPVPMNYLTLAGSGVKHTYLTGRRYVQTSKYSHRYDSNLYVVDLATGAFQQLTATRPAGARDDFSVQYTCWSDQAAAVVCTGGDTQESTEILGFDDNSGQKAWGYSKQSANRIVPRITTAYHGVVYAQAESEPILLNAASGEDLPTATPTATPTDGATAGDGTTPSGNASPGDSATPTAGASPTSGDSGNPNLADYDGTLRSPTMVSPYGGVYLQPATGAGPVFVVLKATA